MDTKKLLFVYNADSGIFNELKDFRKKIVDKESYQCNLCGITFGLTGMKKQWKQFLQELNYDTEFLHRDRFYNQFDRTDPLPAIFLKKKSNLKLLISRQEINSCTTLNDLISLISQKITNLDEEK